MDQIPTLERQLNALKEYYGYRVSNSHDYSQLYHGMLVVAVVYIIVVSLLMMQKNNNGAYYQPPQQLHSNDRYQRLTPNWDIPYY